MKYRELNPPSEIPSASVGALNELLVSCDLIRRKWSVFRALSPSCPCDLVVLRNGGLLRIEVTTGSICVNKKVSYPDHDLKKRNILATILHDGRIIYTPELPII